jgi:predicted enzyme related to lactoylglutathione lyase
MQTLNRLIVNISSEKLAETRDFYTALFDFKAEFDSDWFVNLISSDRGFELGIIRRDHEIVPKEAQTPPGGIYLTLVVDDVDGAYERAKSKQAEIVEPPANTFYGQRRMLLKDPNGIIIDVSSPNG